MKHDDPVQGNPHGGGGRVWLIAGTGEGPPLAARLIALGWQVQVSVVTPDAALAYLHHPELHLDVGVIPGPAGVIAELGRLSRSGGVTWVIDASHPFASRISHALAEGCSAVGQPLLRLRRPRLPLQGAKVLEGLEDLAEHLQPGEPILLAIGSRWLLKARRCSPMARHHCRILPRPGSLQLALAAGFPPERVACLHPDGDGRLERALCRRWGIRSVLCRQSGGESEERWHGVCRSLGLNLLLLARPEEPDGVLCLTPEQVVAQVGPATRRGDAPPAR